MFVLVIASLLSLSNPAQTDERPKASPSRQEKEDWKGLTYQAASDCMDCHTSPRQNMIDKGALNLVLLTEYAIWRTEDKHAQAFAVLKGERGKSMARLLGVKEEDVAKNEEVGCLNCHAMVGLKTKTGKGVSELDGVSCGGCHGPSEQWVGPHANADVWRGKTPEQKRELGMRDVRDPEVRSALCLSCHVGNPAEGKVVTHAMFAAGHPPLPPIEISTFSDNEPRHWREARDVPFFKNANEATRKNYHLEDLDFHKTKFALIGTVVAFRETMKLVAERADDRAAAPKRIWPELVLGVSDAGAKEDDLLRKKVGNAWPELAMAHSDCYGCHHDLRFPGYRQVRGFGYQSEGAKLIAVRPGRPTVRTWPVAPLELAIRFVGKAERAEELRQALRALAAACDAQPFGRPGDIFQAATQLANWSDALIADLRGARYTSETVRNLILDECKNAAGRENQGGESVYTPDYESARQLASILRVAYEEWYTKEVGEEEARKTPAKDTKAGQVLARLGKELSLEPYIKREERNQVILKVIQGAAKKQAIEGQDVFVQYVKKIGDMDLLLKMKGNPFLRTLADDVSNQGFTDQLLKQDVSDKLQQLSDEEERAVLKQVAEYQPDLFRSHLAEFLALYKPRAGKDAP